MADAMFVPELRGLNIREGARMTAIVKRYAQLPVGTAITKRVAPC